MAAHEIRIGVLGCGFYAQNHLHSWRDLRSEGALLSAVCDLDAEKAAAAGRAFGVPHYTDASVFLRDAGLDAVDIVTRQDSHRALAEAAIERKIATIVQKPFAPSWEDCVEIVRAAEGAGVWLAVHENFRFQAPMRRVREIIDGGAIGTPDWGRIRFRTDFDVYQAQPYFAEEDRLVIADVGVHMLDLARFLLGDIVRISCETQRRGTRPKAEDTATMLARHANGAVSVIECTYEAHRAHDPFPETLLEIEGPSGSILLDADCKLTLTSQGKSDQQPVGTPLLSWTAHPWHVSQEGAYAACRHFLHCIQRGVPAETNGTDNLKTYALVEAAYRAASEARAIEPKAYMPIRPN